MSFSELDPLLSVPQATPKAWKKPNWVYLASSMMWQGGSLCWNRRYTAKGGNRGNGGCCLVSCHLYFLLLCVLYGGVLWLCWHLCYQQYFFCKKLMSDWPKWPTFVHSFHNISPQRPRRPQRLIELKNPHHLKILTLFWTISEGQ
jgi:hypothetical protein